MSLFLPIINSKLIFIGGNNAEKDIIKQEDFFFDLDQIQEASHM